MGLKRPLFIIFVVSVQITVNICSLIIVNYWVLWCRIINCATTTAQHYAQHWTGEIVAENGLFKNR